MQKCYNKIIKYKNNNTKEGIFLEEENFKVEDIVNALRDRWQFIVCITLVATIVAAVLSYFVIKPKYTASTKLFIGKETENVKDASYSNNDVQMYQKLLKTYSDIITTRDLMEKAVDNGELDVTPDEALGGIAVTPKTDTQILEISYTGGDKQVCKDIVEAVSNEFVKESADLITNSNVKVIEKVQLPAAPVSPNKKLNMLIAFILGLMCGSGISIILEFLDNTFKDKDQVEKILDLPVLGSIPNTDVIK